MNLTHILKKAENAERLTREEVVAMLSLPPQSPESYLAMGLASRLSREVSGNKAEIHAQLALNLAPCPRNCLFCSFATANGVFTSTTVTPTEAAVAQALAFERDGANAIYIMATANFDLGSYLEASHEIRNRLHPQTTMIANVGDEFAESAEKLVEVGYDGVYHAVRLREGVDTTISVDRRKTSIRAFQEAGLPVGTCVEPVGPEHTDEEVADAIMFTATIHPSFSGAARRIPIPNTPLARHGMISELRMAQIVAVTRLAMPRSVMGNCSHEPGTVPIVGGANLLWAEAGANPRDTKEKTEEGRGHSVAMIRRLFTETEWDTRQGPSGFFTGIW